MTYTKCQFLLRESYRITLYIHLRLVQNWRFVWEGLEYLTGFDQVLLLSTLCKQVRDEVQARERLSWSDWWVIGV